MIERSPLAYQRMKEDARANVIKNHNWEEALGLLLTQTAITEPLWEKKIA
jgi:hypothetical protein